MSDDFQTPSEINQIMQPDEMERIGVTSMTTEQQQGLFEWGMKMRSTGKQAIQTITLIKYSGKLVTLEDGSRWEINNDYIHRSEDWEKQNRVLVVDDMMWNLDEMNTAKAKEDIT